MRYPNLYTVFFTLLTLSVTAAESPFVIGDDIKMGDTEKVLSSKLKNACASLRSHNRAKINFPLAANSESHLVCQNYSRGDVHFDKAVFVVADNHFTQMEASGVSAESIQRSLGKTDGSYLGMQVYSQGDYWFDSKASRLIWISDAAKHPNLFAWRNPMVSATYPKDYNRSTRIPTLLNFDAGLETLRPEFKAQCSYVKEEQAKRIWLPNKPSIQVQINCFGYEYAGFERKFEAVFGDGKLQVVWILTGKQEEQRIKEQLIADWGQPDIANDVWEVFDGGRLSLRKDKPELLVLSDEMIPLYKPRLMLEK